MPITARNASGLIGVVRLRLLNLNERARRVPVTLLLGCVVVLLLPGCAGAPAVNVVGSYFPAWMLCTMLGLIAAVCFRQVLMLCRLEDQLVLPLVTYALVALTATLAIWLLWFGH